MNLSVKRHEMFRSDPCGHQELYLLDHFLWTDPAEEHVHHPGGAGGGQSNAVPCVLTDVGVHRFAVQHQANGLVGEREPETA